MQQLTRLRNMKMNIRKCVIIVALVLGPCFNYAQVTEDTTLRHPFVLGEVRTIFSKALSENRVLNIYTPPGYNPADTVTYPVIYMLDGSADEDFIHLTGLIQFLNFPWVNVLPASIVVGIANVDRRRDFTFPTTIAKDKKDYPTTGKSGNFIKFIAEELKPYITRQYKTSGNSTIIGESLGGLLLTEILLKGPSLFNRYIIVSPSLWWDNESLLSRFKVRGGPLSKTPVSVFIAVGNEGERMINDGRKLARILLSYRVPGSQTWFEAFPGESHATILHKAVYKAFEVMGAKKQQSGRS